MKRIKTLKAAATLCIMHCALCITSCSTDDLATSEPTTSATITVKVSDNGFANPDGTRAEENGYYTTFTSGDQIGVFAVRGGAVDNRASNVCMTYDGSSWSGTLYNIPGATYYAYYPYTEGTTIDASASDVFSTLVSNWQVQSDQSSYTDYTRSDLMTAKGTLSSGSLSFDMTHRMSLVVIDLPKTKYTFTNENIADYYIPTTVEWASPTDFNPCLINGTYRKIYKSTDAITIRGTYNDGNNLFSQSVTPETGKYTLLKVDGAKTTSETSHALAVGDYFMADGTIVSKDVTLSDDQKNNCIGVVFKVGVGTNDDIKYYQSTTSMTEIHGYVVSKTELNYGNKINYGGKLVDNKIQNGKSEFTLKDEFKETVPYENFNYGDETSYNGYQVMRFIRDNCPSSEYSFPMYDYCDQFTPSAPSNTSGWYIPSAAMFTGIVTVKDKLSRFRDDYYSCTDATDENHSVLGYENQGSQINSRRKNDCNTRGLPVLTF